LQPVKAALVPRGADCTRASPALPAQRVTRPARRYFGTIEPL
jgi:hypothetical protein